MNILLYILFQCVTRQFFQGLKKQENCPQLKSLSMKHVIEYTIKQCLT